LYSCDDSDQIRNQVKYMKDLQEFIDAKNGGLGKGWFQIAKSPIDARRIIANDKLAVILGVESSELFGCGKKLVPCTRARIDAGLDEVQSLGISSLFPIHKFDNAFGGTRMDYDLKVVNTGNELSAGHSWTLEPCTTAAHDNQKLPNGEPGCNVYGLSELGAYLIEEMISRGMIIHVDHMSVKTAIATLDIAESRNYSGLISEHSWSDLSIVDRVLELGGVVGLIGDNSKGFVGGWRKYKSLKHGDKVSSIGLGSDVNGLSVPGGPERRSTDQPMVYPFKTLSGMTGVKQVYVSKEFDINTMGIGHYGMYAEWLVDSIAYAESEGEELKAALLNSIETYVVMWEKAIAQARPKVVSRSRIMTARR
jgi:hypothetical protein